MTVGSRTSSEHPTLRPLTRVIADRYRLEAIAGRGGQADVFAAFDCHTQRQVALKLFAACPRDAAERLLEEARRTAAVANPHVVAIFDAGLDGDLPFLVMELLEGQTLGQRLAEVGLMTVGQALHLTDRVLRGLTHIHAKGFLHADLKPSNVFLTEDWRVKIIDFGISRAHFGGGEGDHRTIVGTAPYLAPEVILAHEPNARSDVYGVGLLLYSMLTGRPAYRPRANPVDTFREVMSGSAKPLARCRPDLSPTIVAIVERAMAIDPEDRFESAHAMRDTLRPHVSVFRPDSLSDLGRREA